MLTSSHVCFRGGVKVEEWDVRENMVCFFNLRLFQIWVNLPQKQKMVDAWSRWTGGFGLHFSGSEFATATTLQQLAIS